MDMMNEGLPTGFDGTPEDGADNGRSGNRFLEFCGMKLIRFAETGGPVRLIGKRTVDGKKRVYEIVVRRDCQRTYSEIRENERLLLTIAGFRASFAKTEHAAVSVLHRFLLDRKRANRHKRANRTKNRKAAAAAKDVAP